MSETKQGFMSFSNYSLKNDIPAYVEQKDRTGFIKWGLDNLYPNYLLSLVNRSPLHSSIVNMKSSMIGRNGFVNNNWSPQTINFIKNLNNQDDLETILAKISSDLVIFGGFCLNIRWSKDKSRIAEINYVPVEVVRILPAEKPTDEDRYQICEDWSNLRKNPVITYDGFSTINSGGNQILYVKEHRSTNNWYPVPEYIAGISMMETQYQINEYHLYSVLNQFNPSMHINFPYVPNSDEERDQIVRRLKAEYEGAKKAGNVVITFSETSDGKPTLDPIETNDSDTKYIELKKDIIDGVVSAHQLTDKKLLGLEISGELGGHKNELIESLSVFQAQYVCAKQSLIEKILNKLAAINSIPDKLVIQKYTANLTVEVPVGDLLSILQSTLTSRQKVEILINKGLTRDEASLLVNGDEEVKTEPTTIG
jgi:hypothetical protein